MWGHNSIVVITQPDWIQCSLRRLSDTTLVSCVYSYYSGEFISAQCIQIDHVGYAKRPRFYIAQYPVPWQTCSFQHKLDFSGEHSSHAAIMCEDYSLTFPPPSTVRYSFIQLSKLGQHGDHENAQTSKLQSIIPIHPFTFHIHNEMQ